MRLWNYKLIESQVLPNQMLISQWRELIAIKRKIDKCGTPQHRLVNKVLDYSIMEYKCYTRIVYDEMIRRGMKPKDEYLREIFYWNCDLFKIKYESLSEMQNSMNHIYQGWHEGRYLRQNLYNLEEKYDCGIISNEEWNKIKEKFGGLLC